MKNYTSLNNAVVFQLSSYEEYQKFPVLQQVASAPLPTQAQSSSVAYSAQPSIIDPVLVGFMEKGGSAAAILFVSFAGVCALMHFMTRMLVTVQGSKKK